MKTSLIRSFISIVTAITCMVGFLIASNPASAANHVVAAAQAGFTVNVTAPSDAPVTFMSKGKKVTIKAGESAKLPADAKEIKLPAGAKCTVNSTPAGATTPSSNTYTGVTAVTLSELSQKTLKANSKSFKLVSQTGKIKLPSGSMIDLIKEIRSVAQTAQGAQTSVVTDEND